MSFLRRAGFGLAKTQLRSPLIWLRHRGLDISDVMIASYPRSGNTWLRFLLAEIVAESSPGFDHISKVVPEIGLHFVASAPLPGEGRLIKTHECYRREYARAIYLARDVRDVALSYFERGKHLGVFVDIEFETFLPRFLDGKMNTVGSWQGHVRAWLESPLARQGNLLAIRFEDMRMDTENTLLHILEFLGIPIDRSKVRDAIASNALEQMRAKEQDSRRLPQISEEGGRFVRKGAVAGWREKLSVQQVDLVARHAGAELVLLGYPER
jgi:hypothetical protein